MEPGVLRETGMVLVGRTGRPGIRSWEDGGDLGRSERYFWVGLREEEVLRASALISQVSRGDPIILLVFRDGWRIEVIGRIRMILRSSRLSNLVRGTSFRAFKELLWLEEVLDEEMRDLMGSLVRELGGQGVWQSIELEDGVLIVGEILLLCDREAPDYIVKALSRGVKYDWGTLGLY